jgi:hypothetical protein
MKFTVTMLQSVHHTCNTGTTTLCNPNNIILSLPCLCWMSLASFIIQFILSCFRIQFSAFFPNILAVYFGSFLLLYWYLLICCFQLLSDIFIMLRSFVPYLVVSAAVLFNEML